MAERQKIKSFDDWSAQEVRDTFGIEQLDSHALLTEWLSVVHPMTDWTKELLEQKRALLERFYRSWNEDELKFRFIAHIVEAATLSSKRYNVFTQRRLATKRDNISLHGKPEVMVATGQEDPKKPYFFIHEYKPTKLSGDPLGQLLAAMLAAQTLNNDNLPLFGCFVIANTWQFLVLDASTYTLSRTYDAIQTDDLQAIFSALYQTKTYIDNRIDNKNT